MSHRVFDRHVNFKSHDDMKKFIEVMNRMDIIADMYELEEAGIIELHYTEDDDDYDYEGFSIEEDVPLGNYHVAWYNDFDRAGNVKVRVFNYTGGVTPSTEFENLYELEQSRRELAVKMDKLRHMTHGNIPKDQDFIDSMTDDVFDEYKERAITVDKLMQGYSVFEELD